LEWYKSWTTVNSMNTARGELGGAGTQTAALAFGGESPPLRSATELWNGTSWTTSPNSMATARGSLAGAWYSSSSFSIWWWNTC
jgi:hypothetical protein